MYPNDSNMQSVLRTIGLSQQPHFTVEKTESLCVQSLKALVIWFPNPESLKGIRAEGRQMEANDGR